MGTQGADVLRRGASWVERLPEGFFSRTNQVLIDGLLSITSLYLAFLVRFDGSIPRSHLAVFWAWVMLLPVVRPALMYVFGGYDRIWRYFGLRDSIVLALSALPATLLLLGLRYLVAGRHWSAVVPAGVIVIDYGVFLALAAGARAARRLTFEAGRAAGAQRLRALLVGTDDSLAEALRRVGGYSDMEVVGLLAPETKLQGFRIAGFPVMDEPAALPRLLAAHAVDVVLIADASLNCVGDIVSTATEFGVDVRLLPSAGNVLRGDVRVSAPPRAEDAFSRHAAATVAAPHPDVVAAFRDRVVLVTGAGGSIGAELCRQAANLPLRSLLLLDQDENSIFEINSELLPSAGAAAIVPIVGDIRDRNRMQRLFEQYRPHIVLHAAAYKHVPVMENNCCEAVLNNVFGTREVAALAIRCGAERFLMISTDKAVQPESVMGATKRAAEMLVQAEAARPGNRTRLACVRFGNVVGSRGSVVPIFLKQIAEGQPLTITDENMTRYFMTIPEAVQLVLQAVTLGSNGDVYMLDMGDPVKIAALARKLVEMSGLRPDKDVPVRIVGTRPGEKISEQLWPADAQVSATSFPRVLAVKAETVGQDFLRHLESLELEARAGDERAVRERLREMPIGYAQERARGAGANH